VRQPRITNVTANRIRTSIFILIYDSKLLSMSNPMRASREPIVSARIAALKTTLHRLVSENLVNREVPVGVFHISPLVFR
jgi:hypothetical protein